MRTLRAAIIVFLAICLTAMTVNASSTVADLTPVLTAAGDRFADVMRDAEARRFQVLVTTLTPNETGTVIRRYGYRVDAEYTYAASALKPAAAIAALERIQELNQAHHHRIGLKTRMHVMPAFEDETTSKTSLGLAIRKVLIVSSNRAYNDLYTVAGQDYLNRAMWRAGLSGVKLSHRLSQVRTVEENQSTAEVHFLPRRKRPIVMAAQRSALQLTNTLDRRIDVGTAHYARRELIDSPLSFQDKNRFGVRDLQDMLLLIVRPDVNIGKEGFRLSEQNRQYIVEALTDLPHESAWPKWSRERFDPYRFKPFLRGLERLKPRNAFRLVSKAGKAYGFRVDNAYIEDRATGQAILITATIHTDLDGVINDDRYAYEIADTTFTDLAETIAKRYLWSK